MTKCELVLCRLSHGETLGTALKAEKVASAAFNDWLGLDGNLAKFAAAMLLARDVRAMRSEGRTGA